MVLVQRVIPLYMIYRRGRRERDECYRIKKKKGTREFSVLSHFRLDKQTYRKYSYNLFFFPHLAFLCLIVLPPKTFQSDPPGLPFAVSYIRRCGSVLGAQQQKKQKQAQSRAGVNDDRTDIDYVIWRFTRQCIVVIGGFGLAPALLSSLLTVYSRGRAGDGGRRCGGRSKRCHGKRGGDGCGGRCGSCNV